MSAALAHAPRGFVQRSEYDRLQRELDEARERLAYFESERRFEEDAAATGPAAWKLRPGLAHIVRHLGSRALVTRALLIDNWPGGREPSQGVFHHPEAGMGLPKIGTQRGDFRHVETNIIRQDHQLGVTEESLQVFDLLSFLMSVHLFLP